MTFITASPYLFDSIYFVGGKGKSHARFVHNASDYVQHAYSHFKPLGSASTGHDYISKSPKNNFAGVVFARNNPNFEQEFLKAIAEHRFWNRT